MKTGVQAFCAENHPWDEGILELLMQHRSMLTEPQGKSPAERFLNRHTWMAFEPQSVKSLCDTITTHSRENVRTGGVRNPDMARVQPLFRVGECVLVKAGPVLKGSSPYQGLYIITEVLGWYTFCLSDGQRWSALAMKWWHDPDEDNKETAEMCIESTCDPGQEEVRRPRWMSHSNAGLPPEHWSYPKPVKKKLS